VFSKRLALSETNRDSLGGIHDAAAPYCHDAVGPMLAGLYDYARDKLHVRVARHAARMCYARAGQSANGRAQMWRPGERAPCDEKRTFALEGPYLRKKIYGRSNAGYHARMEAIVDEGTGDVHIH
jgi:hypothetical protein